LDKQSELARSELLNTASIEAQHAAEIRREHERQMTSERAELEKLRDQSQRVRAALASDWARVREAKTIADKTLADVTQLKKNVDQEYATLVRTRETVEQVKGEVQAQQRTLLREISETQKLKNGLQSAEVLRLKTEVERLEAEKANAPKLDYQSKGVLALMEAEPKWKELVLEATGSDSVRMALISIANDTEMAQDAQKQTDHTKGLDQQTPDQSVYQSNDSYGL
jgi:hypothetical protein